MINIGGDNDLHLATNNRGGTSWLIVAKNLVKVTPLASGFI